MLATRPILINSTRINSSIFLTFANIKPCLVWRLWNILAGVKQSSQLFWVQGDRKKKRSCIQWVKISIRTKLWITLCHIPAIDTTATPSPKHIYIRVVKHNILKMSKICPCTKSMFHGNRYLHFPVILLTNIQNTTNTTNKQQGWKPTLVVWRRLRRLCQLG